MMNSEDAWRTANRMHEAADKAKRAAEQMDEIVQRLERLLGDGYGGNGVRLLEALESLELKQSESK
jgi:hypothetical protein